MSPRRERRELPLAVGVLVRILVAFAVIAVITHTLVRPFVVPSASMEPTIRTGDRVIAQVIGVDGATVDRTAVIVFEHGRTWQQERIDEPHALKRVVRTVGDVLGIGPSHHAHTVKRVIGLPGETVSCCDEEGRVLVDGEPLDEPYVSNHLPFAAGDRDCTGEGPASARCLPEITVPEDSYLVMGDNRANSSDSVSACRGRTGDAGCAARFVRADQVVAVPWVRAWPFPPGDALRD